jgi:hypothetical protein
VALSLRENPPSALVVGIVLEIQEDVRHEEGGMRGPVTIYL